MALLHLTISNLNQDWVLNQSRVSLQYQRNHPKDGEGNINPIVWGKDPDSGSAELRYVQSMGKISLLFGGSHVAPSGFKLTSGS